MIRFGIAGAAHPHVESFISEATARDDVELVGVYDPDPTIAAALAQRLAVPAYTDHHSLLTETGVEAVAIAAIYDQRPQLIVECLHRGVHVAVDKPMATRLSDLDAIEQAAQASSAHVSLVLEKRYYPVTLAAQQLYAEGVLGEIVHVSATAPHRLLPAHRPAWFFARQSYGGILGDLLTHDLDLALRFTGATSGVLNAHATNAAHPERPEFQDLGAALLYTDDNKTIALDAHWLSPEAAPYHGDYRMQLVGTEGTADLLWKDNLLLVATHHQAPRRQALPPGRRPAQNFFDAIGNQRPPDCDTEHSIAITRVALLAQRSADTMTPQRWSICSMAPSS